MQKWSRVVKQKEPPLCSAAVVFLGRDHSGRWIVREENNVFGGLFVNKVTALRYALFENGNHPEAIVSCAAPLEFEWPALRRA